MEIFCHPSLNISVLLTKENRRGHQLRHVTAAGSSSVGKLEVSSTALASSSSSYPMTGAGE